MQIQDLQNNSSLPIHSAALPTANYVVYFLSRNGQIVYIGKSSITRYARRVYKHSENKDFDRVDVMPVSNSESETLELERGLISMYRPEYNIVHNYTNPKWVFQASQRIASEPSTEALNHINWMQILIRLCFGAMLLYGLVMSIPIISLLAVLLFVGMNLTGMLQTYIAFLDESNTLC